MVTLRRQYRMAGDIMALPNALVYGGALRCGSEAVEKAVLALPRLAGVLAAGLPAWAAQARGVAGWRRGRGEANVAGAQWRGSGLWLGTPPPPPPPKKKRHAHGRMHAA